MNTDLMSHPLAMAEVESVDDATRPYTRSQIDSLRQAVEVRRICEVSAQDFANFGTGGTPVGMVGSESAPSRVVSGSFVARTVLGDVTVEVTCDSLDTADAAEEMPQQEPEADAPVARTDELSQAQTRVHRAAVPAAIDDEAPTAKLSREDEVVAEATAMVSVEDCEDPPQPRSGARWRWIVVLAGIGVALVAVALRATTRSAPPADADLVETSTPAEAPQPRPEEAQGIERDEPPRDIMRDADIVPQIEPEPAPETTDVAEKSRSRQRKGRRRKPEHTSKRCGAVRDETDRKFASGDWRVVLNLTQNRKCWSDANQPKLMRMSALFELGRIDECIELGTGSTNSKIAILEKRCRYAKH